MVTLASESGIELFLPHEADLIWSFVVLVILLLVFGFYIMPKFTKVLDERARRIKGEMEIAKKTHEEAMEAKAKYEKDLANIHSEAMQIRNNAEAQAHSIVTQAQEQAQKDTERMTQQAQENIAAQRQKALDSLKEDVGTLAVNLAEKILGQELQNTQAQSKIIDGFLNHLEEDSTSTSNADSGSQTSSSTSPSSDTSTNSSKNSSGKK